MREVAMATTVSQRPDLCALAHVLFASPVQPSQCASQAAVKAAIEAQLRSVHGDPAPCVQLVAQQAGDHPDLYLDRMQWARKSVARAYADRPAGNAGRPSSAAARPPWADALLSGAA
jgi:hypothetical protein